MDIKLAREFIGFIGFIGFVGFVGCEKGQVGRPMWLAV